MLFGIPKIGAEKLQQLKDDTTKRTLIYFYPEGNFQNFIVFSTFYELSDKKSYYFNIKIYSSNYFNF